MTNDLTSFSEQQLVSCDRAGNMGCNGGSMALAFMYVMRNPLSEESAYPYVSGTGTEPACDKSKTSNGPVKVSTFHSVTPQSSE